MKKKIDLGKFVGLEITEKGRVVRSKGTCRSIVKKDYSLGTYKKGRFTPYGYPKKKDVHALLNKNSYPKTIKEAREGKEIHGSYKKGIFTPFPSIEELQKKK